MGILIFEWKDRNDCQEALKDTSLCSNDDKHGNYYTICKHKYGMGECQYNRRSNRTSDNGCSWMC